MLPLLAQALDAASSAAIDPVVSNWIVGALGALMLYEKLTKVFGKSAPDKREISGSIDTRPSKEPADKSEVEGELEDLEGSIQRLSEKLDSKVAEILTAGQARADTITRLIASEIAIIRSEMDRKIEAAHEKINDAVKVNASQDAHIQNLQSRDYTHDASLAELSRRISAGVKPR